MRVSSKVLPGLLFFALLLFGCDSSNRGGNGDDSGPERVEITQLPRSLSASEQALISASAGFGLELAARTAAADSRANVILSPLSASMALGMTLNGANDATFEAMRAALGFNDLTQQQINQSYRDLIDLLADLDASVAFSIANAIWAHEGVPFRDEFFQTISAAFDAQAESRDFADPATLPAINEWVQANTGGYIDSIVDSLDPALVMLLVNAIYFDGAWSTQFDPQMTGPHVFSREDGSSVQVDMMSMDNVAVLQAQGSDYSAIELEYGGGAFSMVIVLPHMGVAARDWLAALNADTWAALTTALSENRLDRLQLPRFTLTYDAYLNDALIAMGMGPAFRPGADFTRMSALGDQMCIDFVRQKTYVEVDERGTRAAAATGVGIGLVSFIGFTVDRPFVFAIRERLSGTLLFVGLVGDPTADDTGPDQLVSECTGTVLP